MPARSGDYVLTPSGSVINTRYRPERRTRRRRASSGPVNYVTKSPRQAAPSSTPRRGPRPAPRADDPVGSSPILRALNDLLSPDPNRRSLVAEDALSRSPSWRGARAARSARA